mgnify:FL=1|jgi:hypothetical protein
MKINQLTIRSLLSSTLIVAACAAQEIEQPPQGPRPAGSCDRGKERAPGRQSGPGARQQTIRRPGAPGMLTDDPRRPVELIARDLGVTTKQFREAFKKVRPAPRGERPTEEQREANHRILIEALGVSPEKLDAVMDKYRPEGRGREWGVNPPPRDPQSRRRQDRGQTTEQ